MRVFTCLLLVQLIGQFAAMWPARHYSDRRFRGSPTRRDYDPDELSYGDISGRDLSSISPNESASARYLSGLSLEHSLADAVLPFIISDISRIIEDVDDSAYSSLIASFARLQQAREQHRRDHLGSLLRHQMTPNRQSQSYLNEFGDSHRPRWNDMASITASTGDSLRLRPVRQLLNNPILRKDIDSSHRLFDDISHISHDLPDIHDLNDDYSISDLFGERGLVSQAANRRPLDTTHALQDRLGDISDISLVGSDIHELDDGLENDFFDDESSVGGGFKQGELGDVSDISRKHVLDDSQAINKLFDDFLSDGYTESDLLGEPGLPSRKRTYGRPKEPVVDAHDEDPELAYDADTEHEGVSRTKVVGPSILSPASKSYIPLHEHDDVGTLGQAIIHDDVQSDVGTLDRAFIHDDVQNVVGELNEKRSSDSGLRGEDIISQLPEEQSGSLDVSADSRLDEQVLGEK